MYKNPKFSYIMQDNLDIQKMTKPRLARAYVPGHITGLFRIYDDCEDSKHCGSTGAGFCISAGTVTTVEVEDASFLETKVEYNKKPIDGPVTKAVVESLARDYECSFKVYVQHDSSLPIGVGWGASGAGALGTALAFSSLISDKIPTAMAATYAHVAEVENHTGLGDVIAQTSGGFEIRHKPGSPELGEITKLIPDTDYHVVLAGGTGLLTSEILTNETHRMRINQVADTLISNLLETPTVDNFVNSSRHFSSEIGLESDRIISTLDQLDAQGIKSGMVMLGDSIFCLCKNITEVKTAHGIVSKSWNRDDIITTTIEELGGRLL
jgi:pantoate kinase